MKKIALLFILVFLPMLACADAVEIDGIYYTLVPDSKVAEVTSDPNKYTGDITIPTTIEYDGEVYDVTAIGNNAFYDCKNISSVTIGNSVESIGHYAFAGCGRLASLTIPNSVGTIGNSAFSLCNGLRSLNIGNSVTSIGRSTFNGCSSLSSVIIPNGVTSIGDYAFQQCIGMASVTIPNSVTSIGNAAFLGCGLTSVTIPNSVKSIGDAAFQNCQRVTSIIVEDGNPVYDSRNNSNAIIETASNRLIAGCNNTTIPNGVTSIGNYAFQKCLFLTSVIIPSSVTSIGDGAFRDCRAVREIVNKAQTPPVCGIQPFYGINISECKLYVPASSVSAYQAVEPWKNFKEIVALPAQGGETDDSDYIPFVELGKSWHVVYSDNPTCPSVFLTYYMYKEEERDGKTYILIHRSIDEQQTSQPVGLFREENRRVYEYDEATGREYMLYDFTLKESDTFTYEPEPDYSLKCKVLKQGWLDDGPQIASSFTLTSADTIDIKYRRLRTWTIGCENKSGEYREIATWVEGVGTLENMFCSLNSVGQNCLAYIERKDNETSYHKNDYLPFSFYNMFGQVYGCELPIGAENNEEDDEHHKLTYELEGDRLHVYGEVFCNCGPNHYAYFCEKPTDDPSVHKIEFITQDVEPLMWCVGLHATGFYVSGFDPNLNYIVVDNQGVEHPVINKTSQLAYRPFIEEGKVWKVGSTTGISDSIVKMVEYYYFDGDTIIDGKTCKKMMCQRYVSPDFSDDYWTSKPSLSYVGAWYEEDKKVYLCQEKSQYMYMMYDYSLEANDTLLLTDYHPLFIIGPKQTGGIEGFKGVYRDIMICGGEGQDIYSTTWLEGIGGIDGPTRNVYPETEYDPTFLMACYVGDEVIYLNDAYEDGATPEAARKDRIDFTHTIKIKPKSRTAREAEAKSLYGEYNSQQLGINLNALDEAYQVSITDEAGKAVYEKTVNAGSIVGLNIDISAYAKGRYTVTVENSNESFTGQFETQATGIQENVRIEKFKNGSIYNLQGQRINSLRKGLNIVDGRKMFVK